jgi:hypothetical protein
MLPFTISKGQRGNIVPIGFIINDYLDGLDEPKFVLNYFFNISNEPTPWKNKLQDEISQSSSKS